jgi:hypothetical protein
LDIRDALSDAEEEPIEDQLRGVLPLVERMDG